MGRKSASRKVGAYAAAAAWIGAALLVQSMAIVDIDAGGATRELQERIELQLKQRHSQPAVQSPERTHEDPIDPWELVGV
jgi:hypothetical protein